MSEDKPDDPKTEEEKLVAEEEARKLALKKGLSTPEGRAKIARSMVQPVRGYVKRDAKK
jgi:hypothetical protein